MYPQNYLVCQNILHGQDIDFTVGSETERGLDLGADQELARHLAELVDLVSFLQKALVCHVAGCSVSAEVDGAVGSGKEPVGDGGADKAVGLTIPVGC